MKTTPIFDNLNYAYAKNYNPTKHLVADEITVFFSGTVIFKNKNGKGRKSTSYVTLKGYTYMNVYLSKYRKCATNNERQTFNCDRTTARIGNVVCKVFLSSPDLYDDLLTKTHNCCGTVRSN
jgi:hypothetical protein